jgi:beta-aspartyl-peptidase (threonine type)
MRERYRKRYKAEGKAMGRLSFAGVEIEMLSADAAFVRGGWKLTMPDGSRPGGLFTLIFRKFPEGWKIVHDHTSAEEPQKP